MIQEEVEPIGTAPPKRQVNPAGGLTRTLTGHPGTASREAATGGSSAGTLNDPSALVDLKSKLAGLGTKAPPQETYGPTFRDVGHQQQTAGPQSIQEAYFPDAHLQAQQTGLHRGMGYQPGAPGYSGRDARFIAADIDVPPPGQPAGLDSR